MSNKITNIFVRLTQIAALTLAGATAAYAFPALCPVGSSSTQPTLCSSCHDTFMPSKTDYNGGCVVDPASTTTSTSSTSTSTGSTTTSPSTSSSSSSTTDTTSDTDTAVDTSTDTETDSDSESHKGHKDHKEHKRHTWLDAVGSSHANEHSRFYRDTHDNRLHRLERD